MSRSGALRILQSVTNLVRRSLETQCQFLRGAELDRCVDANRPILDVVELASRALTATHVRTAVGECVIRRARNTRCRFESFTPSVIPVGAGAKIPVVPNIRDVETAIERYSAAGETLEKRCWQLQLARVVDTVVAVVQAERELIAASRCGW